MLVILLLSVIFIFCRCYEIHVDDPYVESNATYALKELRKLSDSGIYSTLSLAKVISAELEDGIYHKNMILNVQLESDFFASGKHLMSPGFHYTGLNHIQISSS